jgi:hypothetical protein
MSVDTGSHVITHIQADCADEKDSRHLMTLVDKTNNTLKANGLMMQNILADGGFCSGENYVQLEARGIQAWIPVIGQHKADRITFTYDEQSDTYTCLQKKSLRRLEVRMAKGSSSSFYYAKPSDCQPCPGGPAH